MGAVGKVAPGTELWVVELWVVALRQGRDPNKVALRGHSTSPGAILGPPLHQRIIWPQ